MCDDWISTGKANKLLNCGMCTKTFRDKFRNLIPYKMTEGGQFRWNRKAVEALADPPETGKP